MEPLRRDCDGLAAGGGPGRGGDFRGRQRLSIGESLRQHQVALVGLEANVHHPSGPSGDRRDDRSVRDRDRDGRRAKLRVRRHSASQISQQPHLLPTRRRALRWRDREQLALGAIGEGQRWAERGVTEWAADQGVDRASADQAGGHLSATTRGGRPRHERTERAADVETISVVKGHAVEDHASPRERHDGGADVAGAAAAPLSASPRRS